MNDASLSFVKQIEDRTVAIMERENRHPEVIYMGPETFSRFLDEVRPSMHYERDDTGQSKYKGVPIQVIGGTEGVRVY